MKLNSPRGSFIVVVVIFITTNSKGRPTIDGKIQPNAELTFKPNFDALNSNIECVSAFALSSAEGTNSTPYWTQ